MGLQKRLLPSYTREIINTAPAQGKLLKKRNRESSETLKRLQGKYIVGGESFS
jgi:hypothetical protein